MKKNKKVAMAERNFQKITNQKSANTTVNRGIDNNYTNGLIDRAKEIAVQAHEGQVRKTDDSPYIEHPLAVAGILSGYAFDDTVIAAALVHDVLEDTEVTETELRAQLGDTVVDIVVTVSEDKSLVWEERKQRYIEQVIEGDESVKAVSVADKIHNAKSLITGHAQLGPTIWKKFNRGKDKKVWFEKLLLSKLKKTWHHPLLDEYETLIEKLEALSD